MSLVVLLSAFFLLCSTTAYGDQAKDCRELGFTGLQLCSDCDTLATYVPDAELVEECRQCCTPDAQPEDLKFQSAVLEVFQDRLGLYPHVETFVKDKAADFHPKLKVTNRWGVTPRLLMRRPNGSKEVIRIDGWKTEHIEEYLHDKLLKPYGSKTQRPQKPPDDRLEDKSRERVDEQ